MTYSGGFAWSHIDCTHVAKHPVFAYYLSFQLILITSEGWRPCPILNLGRFQAENGKYCTLLYIKKLPLCKRKNLIEITSTKRKNTSKNSFATDADSHKGLPPDNLLLAGTAKSHHPSWLCMSACPWHDPSLSRGPNSSFMIISFRDLPSNTNIAHVV